MSDVVHRVSKQLLRSVNTPDYPAAEWLINPDLTLLETVPLQYLKVTGDTLAEMTAEEKLAVDYGTLEQARARYLNMVDSVCEARIMYGDGVEILGSGKKVSTSLSAQIKWMGWCTIIDQWEALGNSFPFRVRTKWDDDYIEIPNAAAVKEAYGTIVNFITSTLQEAEVVKSTIQTSMSINSILEAAAPYLATAPEAA
jgi:hypothetical protein